MSSDKNFGLLRKILRAIGLSEKAADEAVTFIMDLLAGEKRKADKHTELYPYHLRDNFLSPAELKFFKVLESAIADRAFLCIKVGLKDIFYVSRKDYSQFRTMMNKIDRKHVDFLLCDPDTLQPLLAIELDDRSHDREDRKARDAFVDEVFKAAGLKLIHVRVRKSYDEEALKNALDKYLPRPLSPEKASETFQQKIHAEAPAHSAKNTTPDCPRCGNPMLLRTARRGKNAGNQFWGCFTYPACKHMIPYEPESLPVSE